MRRRAIQDIRAFQNVQLRVWCSQRKHKQLLKDLCVRRGVISPAESLLANTSCSLTLINKCFVCFMWSDGIWFFNIYWNIHTLMVNAGVPWKILVLDAEDSCLMVNVSVWWRTLVFDVEFWCLVVGDGVLWWKMLVFDEEWQCLMVNVGCDGEFWFLVVGNGVLWWWMLVFGSEYVLCWGRCLTMQHFTCILMLPNFFPRLKCLFLRASRGNSIFLYCDYCVVL